MAKKHISKMRNRTTYIKVAAQNWGGGNPDSDQGDNTSPLCNRCGKTTIFVAQIDSVEHQSKTNPHSVDCLSCNQKWMFGDVGMIYVFFCFDRLLPTAEFECD